MNTGFRSVPKQLNAAPGTDITKHTPGPWHCDGISEYTGELLVRAENGDTVARVCCYGPQSETPFAQAHNARLIAAAPDLLEALKGLLNYENLGAYDRADVRKQARAAIAKATGGAA